MVRPEKLKVSCTVLKLNSPLRHGDIAVLLATWVLCLTGMARASEQTTTAQEEAVQQSAGALDTTDSRQIGQAPDDISRKLDRLEQPKESMVGRTVLDPVLDRWRSISETLKSETGLAVGIAYTTLYQRLTDKKAGNDPKEGAVGDLDIFGEWSLPGTEADRSWFVGYQAEMRHRLFTSSRPSELGASAGSLWGTTDGFNTQDMSLVQLWWQQAFFDEALRYRIGKVDQVDFFDIGTFNSANLFFSNAAFSASPTIAAPENGLGAAVSVSPSDNWYLNVGMGDANGRKTSMGFSSFFDDNDYFTAAEFGLTPKIQGYGQGYYQFTVWHTDGRKIHNKPKQSSGKGFSLRFEQYFGEDVLPFVTYSRASGGATAVRQLVTAGVGLRDIFGYKDDIVGVAVGWGQPEDRSLRNQTVAELFYRMQISDYLQLTPDIQIIREPSRNRDNDTIGVFGLRLRLVF